MSVGAVSVGTASVGAVSVGTVSAAGSQLSRALQYPFPCRSVRYFWSRSCFTISLATKDTKLGGTYGNHILSPSSGFHSFVRATVHNAPASKARFRGSSWHTARSSMVRQAVRSPKHGKIRALREKMMV